jgi:hypothetical protein
VRVTNLSGHKLPTGYAEGRRMWIRVEAKDGSGTLFWSSGDYDSATGVLTHDAQIKVYRAEQGIWNLNGDGQCDAEDGVGRKLFHFARNDCIAHDNRIPPLGFTGGADPETRPVGYSYPETSPGSGVLVNYDVTPYTIPVPGDAVTPITVTASLWYQTSSKEYIEFLRDEAVTHGFPDDCIDRTTGPLGQSRGEYLHALWAASGRSAPVQMGLASDSAAVTESSTPGEASGSTPMRVTAFDRTTGAVTISYDAACASDDHTVYAGALSALGAMTFSQRFCNRGTSGTTTFTLPAGSFFWIIAGNDGSTEGSYGTNSAGAERPEDTGASACNLPQDLSLTCDP